MAFSKRKAQFVRPQGRLSKVLTLHLSPSILRAAFSGSVGSMADPTLGAYTGLRSRSKPATPMQTPTAARATPTASKDPALSDGPSKVTRRSILKPSGRKATDKSKKHVRIREDARGLSGSSTLQAVSGPDDDDDMSGEGSRPKLKLSFSKVNVKSSADAHTPTPQSATRTPSIKLKLNPKPPLPFPTSSTPSANPKPKKSARPNGATPKIAGKKRKQSVKEEEASSGDELSRRPPAIRKITLTNKSAPTPTLKIKHKGKIPKRPLGVGYDSELSDREADPTLLEAFILRMPPGDDCNYLRTAINNGKFGIPRSQGGADVQIRPLDRHGRRSVVTIQGHKYAAAMVDLPCIIEGMKSWDKKGWIKSADICQMLLVLGRIQSDEDAQTYILPADVNPKTNQYAHGLTPPMRWVRKRRFARTNRTQVSDIEAVERKVNQLLQEDAAALHVKHELIDPEQLEQRAHEMEEYSGEDYDEEDAEGEEVNEGTPGNYFAAHNGQHGEIVDTPTYAETPVEDIGDDEVDEFEAALMDEEDEEPHAANPMAANADRNGLRPPEGDSSFAVTSASASPSATAAHSPATPAADSSDEDEEDEDDADASGSDDPSPNSVDDAEKEDAENLQEVRDKIQEIEEKIQEQTRAMNEQPNQIIRKKILVKINALKGDVEQMRNTAGLRDDDE
jgi:transcription initiation factor TFIID subunit 7